MSVSNIAPRRVRAAADTFHDVIEQQRGQLGAAFAPLLDGLDRFVDDVARAVGPASTPELLDRRKAAKRLGISPNTFDIHVRAGRLPPVLIPSAQGTTLIKRWHPDVLDRFIALHS